MLSERLGIQPQDPMMLKGLHAASEKNSSLFIVHGSTPEKRINFVFRGYIRAIHYYSFFSIRPMFINAGKEKLCETMARKLYEHGYRLLNNKKGGNQKLQEENLGYLRDLRPEDFFPNLSPNLLEVKPVIDLIYNIAGSTPHTPVVIVEMPDEFFGEKENFADYLAFTKVIRHFAKYPIAFSLIISVGSRYAPNVFVEIRDLGKGATEYYVE